MKEGHLNSARVLIVEDEPFIALALVDGVTSAGGLAIGPAASVRQALSLIEADGIQDAILDVNLPDGDIGPVLRALSSKENAPVVIHTGVGLPDKLKAEFPDVPVYIKPTSPTELAYHLARKMNESAR